MNLFPSVFGNFNIKILNNFKQKRGSLDKIIASRGMLPSGESKLFDNEEIFRWSYDILSALTYLRSKCIVHRDVKPQ
jgi:serine/threonine protein kinase